MKKAPMWFALTMGAAWLVWAMVGEAPGEMKPNATAELLERIQNITPTPTIVPPTPTSAATPTRTPTATPLSTSTITPVNVALCQDALQRRQAFLAERFDTQGAAQWGSKTTDALTAEINSMLRLDDLDKDVQNKLKMFALSELSILRSATAAVERDCGR